MGTSARYCRTVRSDAMFAPNGIHRTHYIRQMRYIAALSLLSLLNIACSTSTSAPDITKTMPDGDERFKIRIVELMPYVNDDGDSAVERWTIRNFDDKAVDMRGWTVVDPEAVRSYTWTMDDLGILAPGEAKQYVSNVDAQLNNNGDDLHLRAPDNTVVQRIAFGKLTVGQVIRP